MKCLVVFLIKVGPLPAGSQAFRDLIDKHVIYAPGTHCYDEPKDQNFVCAC